MFRYLLPLCLALGALVTIACSSSGEGGRLVEVTQTDDGCTPASIDATPGEKLNLKVTNKTGNDYEVEGIEGTQLEEVIIPEGRTREVGYDVPSGGGTTKIKCYVAGGVSTIMEVKAGGGSAASTTAEATATGTAATADSTVTVGLVEYSVTPDKTSVEAGAIQFKATNHSTSLVHELAVLRVAEDGSVDDNRGEIEDIAIGASGTVTINLAAGKYQLACLIVPGEAGSTTDHYQEGMHTDFTVR